MSSFSIHWPGNSTFSRRFREYFPREPEVPKSFFRDNWADRFSWNFARIAKRTRADSAGKIPSPILAKEPRIREFLDTCFVMMPFGAWFDRYYQEIYVPAIKDAGLEPVRADELFSTGSVVEQIWEQIEKSKLLLADLSGKNPNVFYELGLAHAAKKPVIFTSSAVDDVPFDLRHLRVIIYEIREPRMVVAAAPERH